VRIIEVRGLSIAVRDQCIAGMGLYTAVMMMGIKGEGTATTASMSPRCPMMFGKRTEGSTAERIDGSIEGKIVVKIGNWIGRRTVKWIVKMNAARTEGANSEALTVQMLRRASMAGKVVTMPGPPNSIVLIDRRKSIARTEWSASRDPKDWKKPRDWKDRNVQVETEHDRGASPPDSLGFPLRRVNESGWGI